MSININLAFTREMLHLVMLEIKPLTTPAERKSARVYHRRGHWEFYGPNGYYWHGQADNAYDARANGWRAWLAHREEAQS